MSVQISAYVDEDIKEKMEHYTAAHGLKKGYVLQRALDYYLNALHEIPGSVIVPSRMVVDEDTMGALLASSQKEPTDKLRQLMHDD